MDPLETTARSLQSRRYCVKELEDRELELKTFPWWEFAERASLRGEIASLRKKLAALNSEISDEKVLRLAKIFSAYLWAEAAGSVAPNRNPFGPAAKRMFSQIFEQALDALPHLELPISVRPFRLADMPEVSALLTDTFIESNTLRIMEERRAIAESTDYLHEYSEDTKDQRTLIVQHRASGLRGQFTVTGPGIGGVISKPYEIESIDLALPGKLNEWSTYVGLGIGVRIYAEAHRLEPDVRWRAGTLSNYSRPLRRKLHAANPYIWAGPCDWCDVNLTKDGIHHWSDAPQSWFNAHP